MAEEPYNINVSGDPPLGNYINPTYDYWTTSPYNNFTWTTINTVYMYQLVCPRCFETNWGEIDKIVTCKGKLGRKFCAAKLKAIKEKVDFEIAVG